MKTAVGRKVGEADLAIGKEAILIGLGHKERGNADDSGRNPRRWSEWAIPEALRQLGYCPRAFTAAQWTEYRRAEGRQHRWRLYGKLAFLSRGIWTSEWVITLGTYGWVLSIVATAMRKLGRRASKVGVVAFFTGSRPCSKLLGMIYRLGIRRSDISLFMTQAQLDEAVISDGCPAGSAALIRIGVDTAFFTALTVPKEHHGHRDRCFDELEELKPYVAVVGDQLRDEEAIRRVLDGAKKNLVRVTRNRFVEEFWKSYSNSLEAQFRVFCHTGMSSEFLRAAYQNAVAVLNLADASWQPAGWSVATEAMACCTPVILQRGLVSDELSRIFSMAAETFMYLVERGDERQACLYLDDIANRPDHAKRKAVLARELVEDHLAIEHTVQEIAWRISGVKRQEINRGKSAPANGGNIPNA